MKEQEDQPTPSPYGHIEGVTWGFGASQSNGPMMHNEDYTNDPEVPEEPKEEEDKE